MKHNLFAKLFFLIASLFGFSAASAEEAVETVEAAVETVETVAAQASSVGTINFPAFVGTLSIMAEGLLGIFTVMAAIWILIWGLCRIAKVLSE